MNKQEYQNYLQSDDWRQKRNNALARAGYACQLCSGTATLNVHHRTYERVKHERDSDLIVLCRTCHSKFHDKLPEPDAHDYREFDPFSDDENPEWHKDNLKSAAAGGLGRWVELAWYTLCRKLGLSVDETIESVSHDLNEGGHKRNIQDGL